MKHPSILYLNFHDAGRAFLPLGWRVPTPGIDAFFRTGAQTYRNTFSVAPTCTPSRAGLLTGLHPHEVGVLGLAHLGWPLRDRRLHLAARLREAGYHTALSGVQHEFHRDEDLPYETGQLMRPAPPGDLAAHDDNAAEAAVRHLGQLPVNGRPFFLAVGFVYPHRPFPSADPAFACADYPLPPGWPDNPAYRTDFAGFCTALALADRCAASVLEALDRSPHAANTLVVVTTDHGPAFPAMKCTLGDAGLGVGLFIRPPGRAAACPYIDGIVSHTDVHATFLDYAGLPPQYGSDGRSLRPSFEVGARPDRKHIHASINHHVAHQPTRCVRDASHLYIRRFDGGAPMPESNIDDGPAKTWWRDTGRSAQRQPVEELFDLRTDPQGTVNLVDDPSSAAVRNRLAGELDLWMKRTSDPLQACGPATI